MDRLLNIAGMRRYPNMAVIHGYSVYVTENDVVHIHQYSTGEEWDIQVPNYGTSIFELMQRPGYAVGWTKTEDFETISLYDKNDDNFGYCINLQWDDCSEWACVYFGEGDETTD